MNSLLQSLTSWRTPARSDRFRIHLRGGSFFHYQWQQSYCYSSNALKNRLLMGGTFYLAKRLYKKISRNLVWCLIGERSHTSASSVVLLKTQSLYHPDYVNSNTQEQKNPTLISQVCSSLHFVVRSLCFIPNSRNFICKKKSKSYRAVDRVIVAMNVFQCSLWKPSAFNKLMSSHSSSSILKRTTNGFVWQQ